LETCSFDALTFVSNSFHSAAETTSKTGRSTRKTRCGSEAGGTGVKTGLQHGSSEYR
jgi:hypothetical protein